MTPEEKKLAFRFETLWDLLLTKEETSSARLAMWEQAKRQINMLNVELAATKNSKRMIEENSKRMIEEKEIALQKLEDKLADSADKLGVQRHIVDNLECQLTAQKTINNELLVWIKSYTTGKR